MNDDPIRIYLVGANGKMGQAIKEALLFQSGFTFIGGSSRSDFPETDAHLIKQVDAILDFSSLDGTKKALIAATTHQIPLVIGTTGHSSEFEKSIAAAAQSIPLLFSPNFSVGMALCLKILPELIKNIKAAHSCKIVETHHIHKKDAPSGSAIKLGKAIDPTGTVPIESIREGDTIGDHRVFFNFEGEAIELRHTAFSRASFANGALMAAKFLVNKPAGIYTLMDLIE